MIHFQIIFAIFCALGTSIIRKDILYASDTHPAANPLEIYPVSHLPICISSPVPDFVTETCTKCRLAIAEIVSNCTIPKQNWCTTKLNNETRATLKMSLKKHFNLVFQMGGERAFCVLGPTEDSIYTHFHFVVYDNPIEFSLQKVVTSDPMSVNNQFLSFSYEVTFVSSPRIVQTNPFIHYFLIIGLILVCFMFILTIWPEIFMYPRFSVVTWVPSHPFLFILLCGSGTGIVGFILTFIVMIVSGYNVLSHSLLFLLIPCVIYGLFSSFTTAVLCKWWGLNDVASALFFAPLFFPICSFAILVLVQWLSIMEESCIALSVSDLMYIFMAILLVIMPSNFIGGLLSLGLMRKKTYKNERYHIISRGFVRNRRRFISAANTLLFIFAFPIQQDIVKSVLYGRIEVSNRAFVLFTALWTLTSISIGISSLGIRMERENDWAIFSFAASSGSTFILWVITIVWDLVVEGRWGLLHSTLYPSITGVLCIALGLASGSVSILSAVLWIKFKGHNLK